MNKNITIIALVLVLLGVGGYLGRHQIKSALMGTQAPTQTVTTPAPTTTTNVMAPTDNIYKVATDAKKGKYLTDFDGRTLYTFDKDTTGKSNCTADCLKKWPVYTSGATSESQFPENISVITRSDGTKQFAWKGMPLYYYVSDTKSGDMNGDGVGGVWHIVKQ